MKKIKYMITSSDVGEWEPTGATTLLGAKQIATKRFGAGYNDSVIKVAEISDTGQLIEIAYRSNFPGAEWDEVTG
jgi:hypothetical protein